MPAEKTRWQYWRWTTSVAKFQNGELDELQELGKDGWEAVGVACYGGSVGGFAYVVVLLKRPTKDQTGLE